MSIYNLHKQKITPAQEGVMSIVESFGLIYQCEDVLVPLPCGGKGIWLKNEHFDIVFTITKAYQNKECIKIEEFLVNEEFRGQGIGTSVIEHIKIISDLTKAKIGLWVQLDNKKGFDFYTKRGFTHKETLRDLWLEYN